MVKKAFMQKVENRTEQNRTFTLLNLRSTITLTYEFKSKHKISTCKLKHGRYLYVFRLAEENGNSIPYKSRCERTCHQGFMSGLSFGHVLIFVWENELKGYCLGSEQQWYRSACPSAQCDPHHCSSCMLKTSLSRSDWHSIEHSSASRPSKGWWKCNGWGSSRSNR